jgi:hypothetical protein
VKALLEDFVSQYTRSPVNQLALAVWFERSPQGNEHKLLMLFTGLEMNKIEPAHHPLLWKGSGGAEVISGGPPFIEIYWTSVTFFAQQLRSNSNDLQPFFRDPKVIYFQSEWLPREILDAFGIVTKPPGLIEAWCVSQDQYKGQTTQSLLASRASIRKEVGILKTSESADFETCKAIVHVQVGQQWLPSSPQGVTVNAFYSDWKRGQPGYFLAEGGALYHIDKFEVIYDPHYASRVIEGRPDDRYVEVYLRAVHPPEQPAA